MQGYAAYTAFCAGLRHTICISSWKKTTQRLQSCSKIWEGETVAASCQCSEAQVQLQALARLLRTSIFIFSTSSLNLSIQQGCIHLQLKRTSKLSLNCLHCLTLHSARLCHQVFRCHFQNICCLGRLQ